MCLKFQLTTRPQLDADSYCYVKSVFRLATRDNPCADIGVLQAIRNLREVSNLCDP